MYTDAANAPGHPTPSANPAKKGEKVCGRCTKRTLHAAGAASVMAELGFPLPEADDHEQVLRWLADVLPVVLAAECPDAQGCRWVVVA